MPAVSKKQQQAMAIAEHAPEKLHAENKGLAKMSKGQLHDFAATPRKGLPEKAKPAPSTHQESHAYNWRNRHGQTKIKAKLSS